ncbi:melanoma-associated antigen 10-like [Orycteropus afer afer]|uniref:Melanoma-associated antigen 10-like n=1 Tax=Orycteropus afer afer TaxID=1230840 RepID=A0AC54Z6Q0_ORYAF|nr:melanoma-associated antigen 10-like [Orycteropus afer afer]
MPRAPKRRRYTLEQDLQAQIEAQALVSAQVPAAGEEECSSSSSFHFSYPCTSSSSSPLNLSTYDVEVEVPAAITLSIPSSPVRSFSSTSLSVLDEDSSSPEEGESPSTSQASTGTEASRRDPVQEKVTDLMQFLLLKYQLRQPITKAEMLNVMIKSYENEFPFIFEKACQCLEVFFDINVKEVDPTIHSYVLVNSLDLTYDEVVISGQGMPKNGLLIIILGVIFLEGNSIPEEEIWELLNIMGIYAGKKHDIYGEPRQLITKDWVQKKYLEYRQVPSSDPARYEFLWGPRAHAETSKMKVLEFLARLNGTDASSFLTCYEEALRDEEERVQARIALTGSTTDSAQCTVMASSLSCPQ